MGWSFVVLVGFACKGSDASNKKFSSESIYKQSATMKFKVETFYNYSFAHWGQNLMEAGKSARTGGIEVKLEYQLDWETTRLTRNRVSVN